MLSGDLVKVIDYWSWRESVCDRVCGSRPESGEPRLVTRSDTRQGQQHAGAGSPPTPGWPTSAGITDDHSSSHTGDHSLLNTMGPEKLDPGCCEVMKAVHGDRSQGRWTDLEWPCDGSERLEHCHSPSPWERRPCDVHHDVWMWQPQSWWRALVKLWQTLNHLSQRRVRKCCSLMSVRSDC